MSTADATPRYRPVRVGGCTEAVAERRPDGTLLLRSTEPLGAYPARLMDKLQEHAAATPDRVLAAQRGPDGAWITVTYAQMLQRARRLGQALAQRGLSAERPIAILSDNDLDHLTLAFAAQWVGVPYAPVSAAYSLLSQDFAKLRHILGTLTPGLVFASHGAPFARAIAACVPADVEVVLAEGTLEGRATTRFAPLLDTEPGAAEAAAHAATGPDTIAKFLFTSGSTKQPKGVVNTQRMLCSNLQMIRQCFAFLQDEPPVLVDWLPWNHTFGGNHNVGIALYNGGSLYIDGGKPTPKGIAATLQNLREIAPTIYFNVPKGFEEIARAMDHDPALRRNLFSRVRAFMYAGAGLSQAVWDHLDRHAVAETGERICMFTGLGMTETAPSCTFAVGTQVKSGHIGLPAPGVDVKLVPADGKLEVRFRGPNVMPGYWRAPAETAAALDAEGFYCTGDAVTLLDAAHPERGLAFDGRIAEDFKLSTGTFVSVGPLRAKVILAGDPLVQDVVVAGINRDDLGLLVFPRLDDARRRFGLPAEMDAATVLAQPAVRAFFQDLLDRLWAAGTGSANRPARALLLAEPPHIDRGEVTDKGSINQRAVLLHRADLVERLYAEQPDADVLLPQLPAKETA
ncbi:feruloyl-CoA synthase [Rubrivivax sp. RP6-9]|uniref:feruloyl-CoA synthase n=1 Tax=Rubrivivax sp. RP6-9 TaxID=3415750 RepID=UPI003CC601FB